MMAITTKENNNEVRIQWRVADIKIPTSEVRSITQDRDIHAVPKLGSKDIFGISSAFGKTSHVIIDTEDHEYIIYAQND